VSSPGQLPAFMALSFLIIVIRGRLAISEREIRTQDPTGRRR